MKLLYALALVCLLVSSAFADTEIEGAVSGEWTVEGSPYIIIGETTIPEGQDLTIQPGVRIDFTQDGIIYLNGSLFANGTPEDSIWFTGPDKQCFMTNFIAENSSASLEMSYVSSLIASGLEGFYQYIRCNNSILDLIDVTVSDEVHVNRCVFTNQRRYGELNLNYIRSATDTVVFTENAIHRDLEFYQVQNLYCCENRGIVQEGDWGPYIPELLLGGWLGVVADFTIEHNENLGIYVYSALNGTINDNSFTRLKADYPGGLLHDVIIHDNVIDEDLWLNGSYNMLVYNNDIGGIFYINNAMNVTFQNNVVRGYYDSSLLSGDSIRFINNTFLDHNFFAGRHDVAYSGFWDFVLRNNIFYASNHGGVAFDHDVIDSDYNCYFGFDSIFAEGDALGEHDLIADPMLVGGNPFECEIQFNSPCIDAGDPDLGEDPDSSRLDIGAKFFDQRMDHAPVITSPWTAYCGNGREFSYRVTAVDDRDPVEFTFENLPDWLEITDQNQEEGWMILSGMTPVDQEDFVLNIIASDESDNTDTLGVFIDCYPATIIEGELTGVIHQEGSPYAIVNDCWVPEDESLTVEDGIEFIVIPVLPFFYRSHWEFNIHGKVQFQGTDEQRIRFWHDYQDYPDIYAYGRLAIDTQDSCILHGVDFEGISFSGIQADYIEINGCHSSGFSLNSEHNTSVLYSNFTSLRIHCDSLAFIGNTVSNGGYSYFQFQNGIIKNNIITNCGWGSNNNPLTTAIRILATNVSIEQNLFYQNFIDLEFISASEAQITRNTFSTTSGFSGIDNVIITDNLITNGFYGLERVGHAEIINNTIQVSDDFNPVGVPDDFGILTDVNRNGDSTDVYGNLILRDSRLIEFGYRPFAPMQDSPVIDAGSDDLPDDPDGSHADIGFWAFDHNNDQVNITWWNPDDELNRNQRDSIYFYSNRPRRLQFGLDATDGDADSLIYRMLVNGVTEPGFEVCYPAYEPWYYYMLDSLQFTQDGIHFVQFQVTDGNSLEEISWLVQIGNVSAGDIAVELEDFRLTALYPNPFNSSFTVRFTVPDRRLTTASIFDLNGRLVQRREYRPQSAGSQIISIDGRSWASGFYVLNLQAGQEVMSRRILLVH